MSCVPSSANRLSIVVVVLRRVAVDSEDARVPATITGNGTGTLSGMFQPKRSWASCLRRKSSPIEYVPAKTYETGVRVGSQVEIGWSG